SSSSRCPFAYPGSDTARSTSKWSPQHASSRPSKPQAAHLDASSSSGRSAHWPVKRVTGRFIEILLRRRRCEHVLARRHFLYGRRTIADAAPPRGGGGRDQAPCAQERH